MGAALPGGAQGLGRAQGSIEINTSDLSRVQSIARGVGQDVARSLGQIDAGVRRTEGAFTRLSRGIGGLRTEIATIGLAGGLLSATGIRIAGSFEEAGVMLRGMTGGIGQANALMADLRKEAAKAGLPFADMLQVARRLLPTFEGNTKELTRWYDIVRRVAVLNPLEGVAGAAFSINEALTSQGRDLVSLVERFNISRAQIRAEMERTGGDFFQALDTVLNRMGITTQTAEDMGQTFNAAFRIARDAAGQLLAEGFTPLLQTLTPLLQQSAAWLSNLRQTNPEVATLGAGLATVATLGAPTLILFNQLVEAGQKLKALGVFSALGRGGVLAGAAVAGAGIGVAGAQAVGRATGNEQLAQTSFSSVFETFRKLIFNIQFTINRAVVEMVNGLARINTAFSNGVANMIEAMAGFVRSIGQMLPGRMGGNALQGSALLLEGGANVLRSRAQGFADLAQRNDAASREFLRGLMRFWGLAEQQAAQTSATGAPATAQALAGGFDVAQAKAIQQWARQVQEIERNAAQARLDATRQFEQQRTQAIADYELQIARDAEDFARQRARQIAQHERRIAEIRQSAAEREADWQADLNERLTKIARDYARDRERAERDHRDRLFDAAARLDAVAVFNEQRQFAKQQRDAEEQQTERLTEEQKAHRERIEAAREADAERLADMQEAFAEQTQLEDEDRAIRLQRQADDFQRQQERAAQAQAERLAQISRQATEQRAALDAAFVEELNQLGLHRDAWLEEQKRQQQASLDLFKQFWIGFNQQFPNAPGAIQGPQQAPPLNQFPSSFSDFGFGRSAAAAVSGGSSRNINIGSGAIVVNGAPGQSEAGLARAVRAELEQLLIEAGA